MKSKLLLLLFLCYGSVILAQDLGIAVNIFHGKSSIEYNFYSELLRQIEALENDDYVVYDWNYKFHKLTLCKYYPNKEKPVELAIFVWQRIASLNVNKLEPNFKVDTSGFVTEATFLVPFEANYSFKVINVKTGKVEEVGQHVKTKPIDGEFIRADPYVKIDVKKYFNRKKTLKVLQNRENSKQFAALKARMRKDYAEEIKDRYNDLALLHKKSLSIVANAIDKYRNNQVFTVDVPDINTKKIKLLTINGGSKDGIKKSDNFLIYSTIEINGKKYPAYIADVYADKVEETTTLAKKYGLSLSAKKLADKLREHAEGGFFAVASKIAVNKITPYPPEKKINIAVAKKCWVCDGRLEEGMARSVEVNLIERAAPELDQLRALYQDERFIDYKLGDYQNQRIGAQYLLSFAGSNLNITDVATGELISVDKATGRKNWLIKGFTNLQAWKMALLDNTEKEITFQRILKEKKGKVKSIEIFHPFEVDSGDVYDISVLQTEEIAGRKVDRKVLIAKGYVSPSPLTRHLGIMKIDSGRKKLSKALKNGQKIVFTYSIKRN